MLAKHIKSGNVYFIDEFISGVRLRNYSTGEIRSLTEENFRKNYVLVEEDYKQENTSSVVDDIIKELKAGAKVKKREKKPVKKTKRVVRVKKRK